ncbi:winged helix-turn-helix domain-containing protein [Actinomadura sp. WMMB 499]|uniref:winged helix-turn-helix domain-containing protein n=1 Tax=Actinomadura sp. WMMB 499 TaxID=1219491 RepID=UPI001244FE8A|nr:winged helix-turn-helix domain-containing protein [Actinomadura sp. WMMB 499]QFG22396.1 winged helix-turn-helix transcriptional regulator [Actinomadura sp. WMMB 499]
MIDLDGMEPLRDQVAAVIMGRIVDGTYPVGRRIPSNRAIADEFGVSTNTAEAAVKRLRDRGLVQGVHGRGTFVIAKPDAQPPDG